MALFVSDLGLISDLLPHACLVIIDDLDLFSKRKEFEAIDGKTGEVSGKYAADWRDISCESAEMSCSARAHGVLGSSFKLKGCGFQSYVRLRKRKQA